MHNILRTLGDVDSIGVLPPPWNAVAPEAPVVGTAPAVAPVPPAAAPAPLPALAAPAAPPVASVLAAAPLDPRAAATPLDALLAYASSGGTRAGSGRGVDPAVLTYGSAVQVRSCGPEGGYLRVSNDGVASACGGGTGGASDVFVLLRAVGGCVEEEGTPVRCGDSVMLRWGEGGRSLGPLPATAGLTSDSRRVGLHDSGAWMVVDPDGALTALALLRGGGPPSLPRPYIALSRGVLLLSHGEGGNARAAVMRLQTLTVGSGGGREALVDSYVGGGRGGPLAPATAAASILSTPPPSSLWSFTPLGRVGQEGRRPPLPSCPSWSLSRPSLTGTLLLPPAMWPASQGAPPGRLRTEAMAGLPPALAVRFGGARGEGEGGGEEAAVSALLDALLGSPGALISASLGAEEGVDWDGAACAVTALSLLPSLSFTVTGLASPSLHPQVADLLTRLLPLPRAYVRCAAWVERRSRPGHGLVAQAAAAAARGLLREYASLVLSLSAIPGLTLPQAAHSLAPASRTLTALDGLLHGPGAENGVGGALINAFMAAHAGSGNGGVRTIAAYLAERASAPLLVSLHGWLYCGRVLDPTGRDFFVRLGEGRGEEEGAPPSVATTAPPTSYWDSAFTLAPPGDIPSFLLPHAPAILAAGKAIAVLNECGTAARGQALCRAAGRAGAAAAVVAWGGLGPSQPPPSPTAALSSPRMPSAILGADAPLSPPPHGRRPSPSPAPSSGPVGSVLDGVFNARRSSLAQSAMAAAGLPTAHLEPPPTPPTPRAARAAPPVPAARPTAEGSGWGSGDEGGAPAPAPWTLDVDLGPAALIAPFAGPLPFALTAEGYGPLVGRAAAFAGRALLRYFLAGPVPSPPSLPFPALETLLSAAGGGADLLGRLRTAKLFFLASSGDWLGAFMEGGEGELGREGAAGESGELRTTVSLFRLRRGLDSALRGSEAGGDEYACTVSPVLATCSVLAQIDALMYAGVLPGGGGRPAPTAAPVGLKGHSILSLDMAVPWPASLVLHRGAIASYQLLFRHLFFLRYAGRAVDRCWAAQQGCKALDLRATLSASHLLRHRMLAFLTALTYYFTAEVLEPAWEALQDGLAAAGTLDGVMAVHSSFLDRALRDCLLTSPDLLKTLIKLTTLCLLFADQIASAIDRHALSDSELDRRAGQNKAGVRARERERGEYEDEDRSGAGGRRPSRAGKGAGAERTQRVARLGVQADAMRRTLAQAGWQALIAKSGRMFDGMLREFLAALAARTRSDRGSHLTHLRERLDLNGFYSGDRGQGAGGGALE